MLIEIIVFIVLIYIIYRIIFRKRRKKRIELKDFLTHKYGKKAGLGAYKETLAFHKFRKNE